MRSRMQAIGRYLDRVIVYISAGMVIVCLVGASVDVLTRTVTTATLAWAQTLAVWSGVAFSFLMLGNQVREKGHIVIDILYRQLTGLAKRVVTLLNYIALVAFAFLMCYSGISYMVMLKNLNRTRLFGLLYFPFWIVILISVVLGGAILLIHGIIALVGVIRAHDETSQEVK